MLYAWMHDGKVKWEVMCVMTSGKEWSEMPQENEKEVLMAQKCNLLRWSKGNRKSCHQHTHTHTFRFEITNRKRIRLPRFYWWISNIYARIGRNFESFFIYFLSILIQVFFFVRFTWLSSIDNSFSYFLHSLLFDFWVALMNGVQESVSFGPDYHSFKMLKI